MRQCARCGAELRSSNAGGLCVRCLLTAGLEGPTNALPGSSEEARPADAASGTSDPGNPGATKEALPRFGAYELLDEIARGGMGVIYRARQPGLGRTVALKMILAGRFASKQMIQRFRGEVTAAALLQHANIVAIHDFGVQNDQHYFSMDYVEGQNLSQLTGTRPLAPAKAARYVAIIAEAIQYAHSQGILHRDLKPSNILIDSATDQPRITDFGLAKRLDGDSSITMTGQMLGSPNFMPPEQVDIQGGKVGRQSDVYGLGAILYYLLTARPPFQAESFESVINQVLGAEPVSPRLLNSSVPIDLETICLKCLQKEPSKRYQKAQDLADELGRFLRDEPIQARPITRAERTWRWCRRKPALAGMAASLLLVLTLGFAGTLWQWRHAVRNAEAETTQRKLADESRERADQNVYDSDMSLAQHTWDDGDLGGALSLLEAHRPRPGERDRRGFEWYYFWNLCKGDPHLTLRGHSNAVTSVAFSPDGKLLATGSAGSAVKIWDYATGTLVKTVPEQNVVSLAFGHDSQTLAVGGWDQVVVWSLQTYQAIFTHREPLAQFRVALLPLGNTLVIGKRAGLRRFGFDGGSTELWDYSTGQLKHVFPKSGGAVAISPRGDRLATGNSDQSMKIWDLGSLELVQTLKTGSVVNMALSPDGQTLATTDADAAVRMWDIASGRTIGCLTNSQGEVWSLAFSPDGRFLATGGNDQMVRLWDMATLQQTEQFRGHGSDVVSVAFSPDGRTLASGGKDKRVMLWSTHPHRIATRVSNVISCPIFSPDGRWIAAGDSNGAVVMWDAATLETLATFEGARDAVAFSDNDASLVTRSTNEFLKTFDVATHLVRKIVSHGPVAQKDDHATLSPDGTVLVVGTAQGALSFFEAKTGTVLATFPEAFSGNTFQVLFSPNGKLLAASGRELEAGRPPAPKIWDVATRKLLATLVGHLDTVLGVRFSPDGNTIATCGADNAIRFWDTTTWKEIPPFLGQSEVANSVTFSPKGKTIAALGATLRLWNPATRRGLASLKLDFAGQYLVFSPDGQTLAAIAWDNSLHLWRAPFTDDEF